MPLHDHTAPLIAGFALLASIVACSLTGDELKPTRAVAPLEQQRDAGGAGGTSANEPDASCRAAGELAGCPLPLTPGQVCESDLDCESRVCVSGACASPSCSDGRRNGDEIGVDCGGGCDLACPASCVSDDDCEMGSCRDGSCRLPSCDDGLRNQGEVGADCAGPCDARCAEGDPCNADADCGPELFCPRATSLCTSVSCQDEIQNGDERAIDCGGGTCPGCPVGDPCGEGVDCLTGVCGDDGSCSPASCDDGVNNQQETGVDCGGECPGCPTAEPCAVAGDCQSGVCAGAGCAAGIELCCQEPSCDDGVQNGGEPVADCGNDACGLCELDSACTANAECATGRCQAGRCQLPQCEDGVANGAETDVDCGGGDPTCARCGVGESCAGGGDCASGSCVGGQCHDCGDGQRNGTETGVDCGGVCGACAPGVDCNVDADCQSGACQDGRCCGGTRADCTRCARRLVGAISCNSNGPADAPDCNALLDCLADNEDVCPVRYAPGCSEFPGDVCHADQFGGVSGAGVGLADAILGSALCDF